MVPRIPPQDEYTPSLYPHRHRRAFYRRLDLRRAAKQTQLPERGRPPAAPQRPDRRSGKILHPRRAAPRAHRLRLVGLGDLALKQILPAFGSCKYSKPVALVSGDATKAGRVADQYGIKNSAIYNYRNYDDLAKNPDVQAIYIVLPNSMHREFTERGAKAGKHILCEKPMATSAKDCERMIAACAQASVKLMIAYRQQYEPMNRAIVKMVKEGKLGTLRSFVASNSQNQGDPAQWRQKLALAGGGCLPDVGIYCLNAARFLTGQEPEEVWGTTFQPKDDSRFTEVEATCSFTLRFPSGLIASCNTGYAAHRSQFLRLEGANAWAELSPAFGYSGIKLRLNRLEDGRSTLLEPSINDGGPVCHRNRPLQPMHPEEPAATHPWRRRSPGPAHRRSDLPLCPIRQPGQAPASAQSDARPGTCGELIASGYKRIELLDPCRTSCYAVAFSRPSVIDTSRGVHA